MLLVHGANCPVAQRVWVVEHHWVCWQIPQDSEVLLLPPVPADVLADEGGSLRHVLLLPRPDAAAVLILCLLGRSKLAGLI